MKIWSLFVISLFIMACGGESDKQSDTVGKEIADDYNAAMDKARNVENELQQHVDDIEKQMERDNP